MEVKRFFRHKKNYNSSNLSKIMTKKFLKIHPLVKVVNLNEGFLELTGDDAVTVTLAIIADEDPNKITVGKAMGYLNGNFPQLRPEMKTLAGKVAKGVAEINKRVKDVEPGLKELQK